MNDDRDKNIRRRRRESKDKKKSRARKVYPDSKDPHKLADHLCECSCPLCCNPRHSRLVKGKHKLTMRERRFFDREKEEHDDVIQQGEG